MSDVFQLLTEKNLYTAPSWEAFRKRALVKWRQHENRKLRQKEVGREGRAGQGQEAPSSRAQSSLVCLNVQRELAMGLCPPVEGYKSLSVRTANEETKKQDH